MTIVFNVLCTQPVLMGFFYPDKGKSVPGKKQLTQFILKDKWKTIAQLGFEVG
jgi:hypothetical protein